MDAKVLLVGTTPDYVHAIDTILPDKVLFLTDKELREHATEPAPPSPGEICSTLSDTKKALVDLSKHLLKNSISLSGIACFDCESMELASEIGRYFKLFFQSSEAIRNSRNKSLSKKEWERNGLNIPENALFDSKDQILSFLSKSKKPFVLKPLSGAGSELVFLCPTQKEAIKRFEQIMSGLEERKENRLFNTDKPCVLFEEFVEGTEYSCDFLLDGNDIQIIRLTEKIKVKNLPFGIIAGYKLINQIPGISHGLLSWTLARAAASVGIDKSICMIDFIVRDGQIVLIEIAPRPGGDCLPSLLLCATGQNILAMNVMYASGKKIPIKDYRTIDNLIALRFFAHKEGLLKNIDVSALKSDENIKEINITSIPEKPIKLPPDDYDSWILGNIIISAKGIESSLSVLYERITSKINISIDPC